MKRFALVLLTTLLAITLTLPAHAGKIPRPSGGGPGAKIDDADLRAVYEALNELKNTTKFYRLDLKTKIHSIIFFAENSPKLGGPFSKKDFIWGTPATLEVEVSTTVDGETKTDSVKKPVFVRFPCSVKRDEAGNVKTEKGEPDPISIGGRIYRPVKDEPDAYLAMSEEANPERNLREKVVIRKEDLTEEDRKTIREFEPRVQCMIRAFLKVERGKKKIDVSVVTLRMIEDDVLKDTGMTLENWVQTYLNVPQHKVAELLRLRDRVLTIGDVHQEKMVWNEKTLTHKSVQAEIDNGTRDPDDFDVIVLSFRDDSLDRFRIDVDTSASLGQIGATVAVDEGTARFGSLIIWLIASLLLYPLFLILANNINKALKRQKNRNAVVLKIGRLGRIGIRLASFLIVGLMAYKYEWWVVTCFAGSLILVLLAFNRSRKPAATANPAT